VKYSLNGAVSKTHIQPVAVLRGLTNEENAKVHIMWDACMQITGQDSGDMINHF